MIKIGAKLHQEIQWTGPFDGVSPRAALGDFNGDKVTDLVINIMDKIASTSDVYIFTGNATGHISEASTLLNPRVASYQNDAIVVADINKDGWTDLVVAQNGGDRDTLATEFPDKQLIYLSNKSGGYTAYLSETTAWAHNAVIADINGDSVPDAFFFANTFGSSLFAYGSKNSSDSISFTTNGLPDKAAKSRTADTWDVIDRYNDGWVKNARIWQQHNANFNDVDRDGDQDMVLFFDASKEGLIYLNDGKPVPDFTTKPPIKFNAVIPGWLMNGSYMFFSRSEGSQNYALEINRSGMNYYETVQFDINQDGWKDIVAVGTYVNEKSVVVDGKTTYLNGTDRYNHGTIYQTLLNSGAGLSDETGSRIEQPKVSMNAPYHYGHFTNLYSVDLNGDGFLDFVSNKGAYTRYGAPNQLGESDTIFMLNDGKGRFSPVVIEGLEYGSFAPMPIGGKLGFVHIGLASRWTQPYNDIKVFQTDVPWTTGDSTANILYGTVGDDLIGGGSGTDTYYLNGRFSDFSFQVETNRSVTITERSGLSGRDTLREIERLRFDDRIYALDTDGNAGQAYRIYKAAFNRDPMNGDKGGLGYWIAQIDKGMDLIEVSARFVDSNEFRTLYGANPTNDQFLTNLYMNVLGRQPEASGFNWWLNELSTNPEKTKGKVLADFAESAENKAAVIDLIGTGITYEPWMG